MDRTVALLLPTFSWTFTDSAPVDLVPPQAHQGPASEAMEWQQVSAIGAAAELEAVPGPFRRSITWNGIVHVIEPRIGTPPREANRLLEIHGLMGAIGEQLGLAWTAEQDAQRLQLTSGLRDAIENRMASRAMAELAGHFLLGSAHSLANLVLRLLLLNNAASEHLVAMKKYRKADGFVPGDDSKEAWPTLNGPLLKDLVTASDASDREHLRLLAATISGLFASSVFRSLDGRRGMDYHRRRPQSVGHTAPRCGVVSTSNGTTTMTMVTARLEEDAEHEAVHVTATAALVSIAHTMRRIRELVPSAIRAEGINYVYDFRSDD
jgi:hypothetical protein